MIELCYCISEDPFFESFSLSKSKTAAVLTPTIQKVEDEECQESDIFMEILVVFVNPQITCLNTEGKRHDILKSFV